MDTESGCVGRGGNRSVRLLLMNSFCASTFSIVGFVGNSQFSSAIEDFVNLLVDTGDSIITELQYIEKDFNVLDTSELIGTNVSSTIQQAVNAGESISNQADSVRSLVFRYNSYREGVMLGSFVVTVVIYASVILAAALNSGKIAWMYVVWHFPSLNVQHGTRRIFLHGLDVG